MPNLITADGLEVLSQDELVSQFTLAFQDIYGSDIVLTSDSPDGQMMMIYIQAVLDLEDLLVQIYNGFDPDLAVGDVLDQRVAINGIQRHGGTYTLTPVSLVVSQALNLVGLDDVDERTPYTVSDEAGNKWLLMESQTIASPGTYSYSFSAQHPGAVLSVPNTITIPITIVLGVDSVNNPTTYTSLGINEETDAELRIRRQRSTAISSQGYLAGLLAALENINEVTFAQVYENDTGSTDGDGIPGHSIWVIVAGTATPADIALAIYNKRNAGCGMKGDESYGIAQVDGTTFFVFWDDVESVNLFVKFTAASLDGVVAPDYAAIIAGLATGLTPGVYGQVNINELATLVQGIDPNTLVTSPGFSLVAGSGYANTLTPANKNKQFSVATSRIIILPILLTPSSAAVASSGTQQFTAIGGYGSITWSMHTSASGSPSVSGSGLYTAGSGTGTDVVRATDSLGNIADANVVVS